MSVKKENLSLAESLVKESIITHEQLQEVQKEEKHSGMSFIQALVKLGFIAEEDLAAFINTKFNFPRIDFNNYLADPKIFSLIPDELAIKYKTIPVLKIGKRLTCAMANPWDVFAIDEIRTKTGYVIEPAVSTETEIKKILDEYYGTKWTMDEVIKSVDDSKQSIELKESDGLDLTKLTGVVEEPLVIKLVNLIMMNAIRDRASDIHIEPKKEQLRIRYRVDGMLQEVSAPPKYLQSAIISRIKVIANLDIAERRVPQDGRFHIKMIGKEVDVRVSCVPTIYGESIVLRLLDIANALVGLDKLGFPGQLLEKYEKLISRPHGIVLVTGPTGSGKTTTLYSSLDKINTVEKNIITIEDPVEYKLSGIKQIQVDAKVNLTFASGLRAVLRQDPDVIMVGEIRDFDTAEISIHAALTGHLVFSTLHTNDAAGSINRLIDMGVEPFLVSSSLIAVLAQRLVRVICKDCKEEYAPTREELKDLGIEKEDSLKMKFYRGKGCGKCLKTGYKGRIGIIELMVIEDKIRNLIISKSTSDEIKNLARSLGMTTLMEDGIRKIKEGITTVEEVLRVTREE